MDDAERQVLENRVRSLHESGDMRAAATAALQAYGAELLGFLHGVLRNEQATAEVFSQFCEDFWIGLPSFRWQASLRTWSYTLARHAAHQYRRDPHLRRAVPMGECPELCELEQRVRTQTLPHLRTEARDRLHQVREGLDVDDQMILILRVDRKMPWSDMARVLLGSESVELDDDVLQRKAAALRKRFERVKSQLRDAVTRNQGDGDD